MKRTLFNLIKNVKFRGIYNNSLCDLGRWNSVKYNKNKEKITQQYSEWANKDNCFGNVNKK